MRSVLLGSSALALVACVDKGGGDQKKVIDPAYIASHLPTSAPALQNQVNADFAGKVIYLGNNVSPPTLSAGGKVTIDHYWQVVEPPGGEWRIFAHVGGNVPQDWMNIDYTDMRVGYPASKWKAGDIIHDEQKFALSNDWRSPYADILVGMYPKGKHGIGDRMKVTAADPKAVDEQHRVLAVRIPLAAGEVGKPPVNAVLRTTEPITIDGKADEAAWKRAPESPDFTFAEGGPTDGQKTSAKLLYDDEHLYVFVQVQDKDVASQYTKNDDPMWKEDVVEIFIDADKSGQGYVELQVNPNNAQFDSWFPQTRAQKFHLEWSAGMKSAVVVHGTLNQRDDEDRGWDVELAIPLAAVKGLDPAMKVTLPPAVGDTWKLNIVRGEKPAKGNLVASSWNPITYKDFHALDRMLEVTFTDAEGNSKPSTAAAPAEPPATAVPGPSAPLEKVEPSKRLDVGKEVERLKKAGAPATP
ncbi:MAG TPA: carbohydrate-binding family 9-like protein [Kofleriaceae bacterium]|nr:carbohydrate-binding family 9-like protein [Kofleriaceae bacterium]